MSSSEDGGRKGMGSPVGGAGVTGGVAGAGGGADDTDTVGTAGDDAPAAGGSVFDLEDTPGGNVTGSKGGTVGGTAEPAEGATSLGVTDADDDF